MHAVDEGTGVDWFDSPSYPALLTAEDSDAVRLIKLLSRNNGATTVSFGTEGGLFQKRGVPAVICGPGDIAQAHKPNEFVELDQVRLCEEFVRRLLNELSE